MRIYRSPTENYPAQLSKLVDWLSEIKYIHCVIHYEGFIQISHIFAQKIWLILIKLAIFLSKKYG